MKIKSLQLKNFKRFTDLTLQDIPENAKLVLLIGSNGSGKSSVFDAFELLSDLIHRSQSQVINPMNFSGGKDYLYYHKSGNLLDIDVNFTNNHIKCYFKDVNSGFIAMQTKFLPNSFYGRSAVRYLPRLTKSSIGETIDIVKDTDKPNYYIEQDKRFENDIDLLIKDVVDKIFKGINTDSSKQLDEIKVFLDKINDAFPRIFGSTNGTKLSFKSFSPPAEGKPSQLIFLKGISEINYNLLSAGEKEIVNLLFNLFVRNKFYNDTIYFMDEVDTHLNTKLQFSLLKEITENWIPDNCQFWTATHSLGFIQYAKENDHSVIFDFDDYDFDYSRTLTPEPKENLDIYDIVISKDLLSELFKSYKKVFVENTDGDNYYSNLKIDNLLFIKRKDKKAIYDNVLTGDTFGLIDRDFLSDEDISILEKIYANLKILKLYSVENYLFHPENLDEYCKSNKLDFNSIEYIQNVFNEKEKIKHELFAKISDSRQTYPFGKEIDPVDKTIANRFSKTPLNQEQIAVINKEIDSPDFHAFYKHIPMKNYLTQLGIRQKISKIELSKTNWFKSQIEQIIK